MASYISVTYFKLCELYRISLVIEVRQEEWTVRMSAFKLKIKFLKAEWNFRKKITIFYKFFYDKDT